MEKLAFLYCRGFDADGVTDCLTAVFEFVPIRPLLLPPPSPIASVCYILFWGNWQNWYHAPQNSFLCTRALFIDSFYARGLISCMHL